MKQTAVEFLQSEFNKWAEGRLFIPNDIIEQAKEIEKEQIMNAWLTTRPTTLNYWRDEFEQYYNETFKSE